MGYAMTLRSALENVQSNDLTLINPNEDLKRKSTIIELSKTWDFEPFISQSRQKSLFSLNMENEEMMNMLNLQNNFYNLMCHGASLKRLLNILSSVLKNQLAIIDMFGEICATSNLNLSEEQMAVKLVKELKRDVDECVHYAYRECGRKMQVCIYPIHLISRNTHYVVVFDDEKNPENVSDFVMKEILLMFSMYFYKSLYICHNEMQARNNFLKLLIEVNESERLSARQALAIGKEYAFRASGYYRIIVARFRRPEKQKFRVEQFMRREERYILVYEYLKLKIEEYYSKDIIVVPDIENWRFVFLQQEKRENLDARIYEIGDAIYKVFGEDMLFAYGNNAYDTESIANSYWDAVGSLNNVNLECEETIIHYQPQNILELLKGMSSSQIVEVCKRTLKELAFPEDETNLGLQKTLKVYLDCHCSIMETANRMYLHRNTVRYRIKKCEEILNNDLSDWDYCFQLQLCLILADV